VVPSTIATKTSAHPLADVIEDAPKVACPRKKPQTTALPSGSTATPLPPPLDQLYVRDHPPLNSLWLSNIGAAAQANDPLALLSLATKISTTLTRATPLGNV